MGLSSGRSLPYNDSAERRGILPHRTEKRKSMREGFRAGAFFLCAKGEGAGGRGRRSGRRGCGADLYKSGKCTDGGKKRGRGVEADRRRTGRADGWGRRTEAGGREETQKEAAGARQRAGEEIDGEGNREIHGERGPLREIAAGGRDGGESADGTGSWTNICMGRGCGKVEQKAAQLIEDVRARGGGKSNVDGARGEKILVEERAREREGEECMARRQREDEKSARGKRRCLYFAAARRGWTEGGIDLREVCAGKIFLQSSETIRRSSWKVCERGGGKSNVDETREKKIPMERGQGTREQVNGCKKQVLRNLPQIAASCSRLQQTAAGCNRLRLESESESNPNRNPNPNSNRSRESNPSCFPRGQQGARAGECSFPREKTRENGEGRKGALAKGMAGEIGQEVLGGLSGG